MRVLVILLLSLLQLASLDYGSAFHSLQSYLLFTSRHKSRHSHRAAPVPAGLAFAPSESRRFRVVTPLEPAFAPAHFLKHQEPAASPRASKYHGRMPHVQAPSLFNPPQGQDCDDITCVDPLTAAPFGSPCGCLLPMQVELDLSVAPFRVLSVVAELEIEIAAGIYMKQSQVRIMGAAASSEDQEKTRVDIDLVPLGEKFDNMTAFLTYERFWQKKVSINASVFGDYDVIFVRYPGLPSSPPSKAFGPSRGGGPQNPFVAHVPTSKNRKLNARTIVIIALSSFVLVLMFMGMGCILLKRKKLHGPSTAADFAFTTPSAKRSGFRSMISSSLASSTSLSLVSTMATCPPSVKTFSLAELENATNKFSSRKVLGEGGSGRVYHGIMEDGFEVAIKLLTREDQSGDREFIAEVEMLSRLHHRNLVKLIGICIEEQKRCLVYELARNGSVESHLHGADKKRVPLGWDARLKIALGAARGLAYLHEDSNPRVIHRDFKASNVVLEDDFTPKVSDFGLAREASEGSQHISTRVMGTFGYVAPEYAMTGHLLVKSDVYSYGVMLLELLSGRKPVDYTQPRGQENLVTWARPLLTSREGLEQLVDPCLSGSYDFDNMAKVAAIASMCVHPEVSQRPFMGEVVQALKLIYNDMDEACEDCYSQREESSAPDCDFKGDTGTDSSWWNGGTPRLTYGCASSFITMEYSSGPVEEIDRPHSTSMLVGKGELVRENRSGPLQTKRHRSGLTRLRGSMSEHQILSRRFGVGGYWV
uniref:Receptor-like serine/threonine-protein kinase ALE2 n=1 Tax=Anthurium amnicola TaxID=1678845 RepID=A0A1D1Z5B2_9ARAE